MKNSCDHITHALSSNSACAGPPTLSVGTAPDRAPATRLPPSSMECGPISPHQLVPITAETIRRLAPGCCYNDERLRNLLGDGCTALEVLTRRDGEWTSVPDFDRVWTMCTEGVMTSKSQRLFAMDCGRRALQRLRDASDKAIFDIWELRGTGERFASGLAIHERMVASAVSGRARWAAGWAEGVAWVAVTKGNRGEAIVEERARQVQWWVEHVGKAT